MSKYRPPRIANEHFYIPSEGDVLTPNGNGATIDPLPCLTTPLVWNADGSITATMTTTAINTLPSSGWACVLPWRDDDGRIAARAPAAAGWALPVATPPAASSGVVLWAGICTDVGLTNVVWTGIDLDGVDPRANASINGTPGVSGTRAGLFDTTGGVNFSRGILADKAKLGAALCSLLNVNGSENTSIAKTANLGISGQTWFAFGAFGRIAAGPNTITFSPAAFYRQLADGSVYG